MDCLSTPIDISSHWSILAAVNPASGYALYHVFSSTYQAHHEAVKKYQRNYEYECEKVATIPSWIAPYLFVEEKYGK